MNTSNAWAGVAATRIDTSICEVIANAYLFAGQNHRSIIPLQHRSKWFFCTESTSEVDSLHEKKDETLSIVAMLCTTVACSILRCSLLV
jgi:hypothetical protein